MRPPAGVERRRHHERGARERVIAALRVALGRDDVEAALALAAAVDRDPLAAARLGLQLAERHVERDALGAQVLDRAGERREHLRVGRVDRRAACRPGRSGRRRSSTARPPLDSRDQYSRHSTSPREPMSARPSHAARTAHASREVRPAARRARRRPSSRAPARRSGCGCRTSTCWSVSSVKPAGPRPSVPASRCSACVSPSRVRSSRCVPSPPMMRGKPDEPEARARQPVRVVGVLDVVRARHPRQALRADDPARDRVAVGASTRHAAREPSSSTTPCVSSSGAIGLSAVQRRCSAASTFGTTDSSA